jgi:hypothetical protein
LQLSDLVLFEDDGARRIEGLLLFSAFALLTFIGQP